MSDQVFGHMMQAGKGWKPLLPESSSLFCDVVGDRLGAVEAVLELDAGKLHALFLVLHWADASAGEAGKDAAASGGEAGGAARATVAVKHRSLLMMAAQSGSLRVLAYLLAKGAEPSRKAPDGLTAYDMAVASDVPHAPTMLAMMRDADVHPPSSSKSTSSDNGTYNHNDSGLRNSSSQDLEEAEGSSYSTSDLTRPEYATDDFRMFNFKVLRCSKRHAHDWRACPFAHPTENARRRDPREFKYCALACPDYKQGFCIRGDSCPYAHGVFECWLHPSRYRSQLCKDGVNCHRPVCFFAHSLPELRAPTYTWLPTPEDLAPRNAAAVAAAAAAAASSGVSPSAAAALTMTQQMHAAVAGLASASSSPAAGAGADKAGQRLGPQDCVVPEGQHPGSSRSASGALQQQDVDGMLAPGSPAASMLKEQHSKDGSKALGSSNLTQQSSAASMLGFTAPRMSNAFARRHGLNPKDNPMLNLQKIALQSQGPQAGGPQQQQQQQHRQQQALNHAAHGGGGNGNNGGGFNNHAQGLNGGGSFAENALRAAVDSHNAAQQHRQQQQQQVQPQHQRQQHHRGGNNSSAGAMMHNNGSAAAASLQAQMPGSAAYGYAAYPSPNAAAMYGIPLHHAAAVGPSAHGLMSGQGQDGPSLLAMQLAQLNLQRQQMGLGLAGMGMAGGVSGMAVQMPYVAASQHQLLPGGYAATAHAAYDQHFMAAAMGGAQAEV